jgi:hypothetical protein
VPAERDVRLPDGRAPRAYDAGACPRAEPWLRPRDGHVSVPVALDWIVAAVR